MAELLITGATVIDGTGAPGVRADVLVEDGRIAGIRPLDARRAVSADGAGDAGGTGQVGRTIVADGLVLAPGFIDMHAHSDLQILANPDHLAKVSQGVTLE